MIVTLLLGAAFILFVIAAWLGKNLVGPAWRAGC